MPLYAQQLLTGPLLSIFVPNHIDSEYGTEDDGYIYTLSLFNPQEETQQHRQRTPPTIADADVVAATRDVLVMLQIYGQRSSEGKRRNVIAIAAMRLNWESLTF